MSKTVLYRVETKVYEPGSSQFEWVIQEAFSRAEPNDGTEEKARQSARSWSNTFREVRIVEEVRTIEQNEIELD